MNNTNSLTNYAGLKRIILADSYITATTKQNSRNAFFEFNFDKHSQINGANGSGKTSLLKLIPLFYGLDPRKITTSNSVRKSFSGFYLPYEDSSIIFEYVSNEQKTVHVVVSSASNNKNSTALAFGFVPCEFDSNNYIYFDEETKTYRNRSWTEYKRYLNQQGIRVEKLVTTIDEYRSIIQNIPNSTNNYMRKTYSLSSGRKELRYIDVITHSLITGKVSFENIKLLLAEILKKDHPDIKLELNLNDLDKFCKSISAYREVENIISEFSNVIKINQSLLNHMANIRGFYRDLKWFINELTNKNKKLNDNINSKDNYLENFKTEEFRKIQELKSTVDNIKKEITDRDNEISQIEKEQEDFENKKATYWLEQVNNCQIIKNQLLQDKEVLNSINSKAENIKQEFDNKRNAINNKYLSDKNKLEKQKSTYIDELKSKNHELESKKLADINNLKNELKSKIHTLDLEENTLTHEKQNIEKSLKDIRVPENLAKELAENSNKINSIQDEARANQQELIKLTNEKLSLTNKRTLITNEHDKFKKEGNKLQQEIRDIERQLSNSDGSLQSFLELNVPAWKDSIGKVLDNELLSRTDLYPVIESTIDNSTLDKVTIGNVTLLTEHIKKEFRNIEELEIIYKELSQKFNIIQHEVDKKFNEIHDLNTEITNVENQIMNLEAHEDWDKQISELKDFHCQIKDRITIAQEKLKNELNNNLNKVLSELKNICSQKNSLTEKYQSLIQDVNNSYLLNKSDIETKYSELINNTDDLLSRAQEQNERNIKELNKIELAKKTEGNVDDKLIDQLSSSIRNNEQLLNDIEDNRELTNRYLLWLPKGNILQNLREKIIDLRKQHQNEEDKLKSYNKQYDSQIKLLSKEINNLRQTYENNNKNIEKFSKLCKSIEDINLNSDGTPIEPSTSSEITFNEAEKQINKYKNECTEIKGNIYKITNCINKYTHSEIYSYWEEHCNESKTSYAFTNETQEQKDIILKANAAKMIVQDLLPQIRQTLINFGRNTADIIYGYYQQLKNFSNRIHGFSNRISNAVTQNLSFEAFEYFNIKLEAKIKDLPCWRYIEEIAETYKKWIEEGKYLEQLPSQEYVDQIKNLMSKFEDGTLRNEINDLFTVLFEVTENKKFKTARSAKELEELSSNGLTFLLMCALYIGLIRESRNEQNIRINWPVDEMSKLSNKNIHILLDVMDRNLITMVSAAPDLSMSVALQFENIYRIAKDGVFVNQEALNPIGIAIAKKQGLL
ncbi:MAG: ATP-binding protein [Succinivibrionaceae bacterium]